MSEGVRDVFDRYSGDMDRAMSVDGIPVHPKLPPIGEEFAE